MGITLVVVLLVVGIVFLILELFFFPGISIAGIVAVISLVVAIAYAYVHLGIMAGNITLGATVVLNGVAIWLFLHSKALDKMALKTDIDGKIDPLKGMDIKVGDTGKTVSRLAPIGRVKINNHIVEAKTIDDFIDPDSEIVVTEIFTTNIQVELKS